MNKIEEHLPKIYHEAGEYVDNVGDGEYGIFGLTKERANLFETFLKSRNADVKVEKSEVIINSYTVYFH